MKLTIATIAGPMLLETAGDAAAVWRLTASAAALGEAVEEIRIAAEPAGGEAPLPEIRLDWRFPLAAVRGRWNLAAGLNKNLPLDWFPELRSSPVRYEPALTLFGHRGENVMSFALAEALLPVRFYAGGDQHDASGHCRMVVEGEPGFRCGRREFRLRLDLRRIAYDDAVRAQARWLAEQLPAPGPLPAPEAAFLPDYNTWYGLCKRVRRDNAEGEAVLAAADGFGLLTLDMGWAEDDDHHRYGTFTGCGDWRNHPERFPDMAGHVAEVQRMGLKYILWCGFPFVGVKGPAHRRFEGRYLRHWSHPEAGAVDILDIRFPEVRTYLADTLERLAAEWRLDGLKLDMLDVYNAEPGDARAEEGDGRDTASLALALHRLLGEVTARLTRLRPDFMIEFRQAYVGFALRPYGNLYRVCDCGGDWLFNRVSIIDLRLATVGAAIHSDPLMWRPEDAGPDVALQIIAVLWGVPQVSVILGGLPPEHRRILRHWMHFHREHRGALLHGRFTPVAPEANYPAVYGEDDACLVAVLYGAGAVLEVPETARGKRLCLINGSGAGTVAVDVPWHFTARRTDYRGEPLPDVSVPAGLSRVALPPGALLQCAGAEREA